jgi:hypothetical protein
LELRIGKPKPKDKAFVDGALAKFTARMNQAIAGLRSMVEGNEPAVGLAEEPTRKPSAGRFLTEPVKSGAPR